MYLYCKVSRKTLLIASVLVSRPSPRRKSRGTTQFIMAAQEQPQQPVAPPTREQTEQELLQVLQETTPTLADMDKGAKLAGMLIDKTAEFGDKFQGPIAQFIFRARKAFNKPEAQEQRDEWKFLCGLISVDISSLTASQDSKTTSKTTDKKPSESATPAHGKFIASLRTARATSHTYHSLISDLAEIREQLPIALAAKFAQGEWTKMPDLSEPTSLLVDIMRMDQTSSSSRKLDAAWTTFASAMIHLAPKDSRPAAKAVARAVKCDVISTLREAGVTQDKVAELLAISVIPQIRHHLLACSGESEDEAAEQLAAVMDSIGVSGDKLAASNPWVDMEQRLKLEQLADTHVKRHRANAMRGDAVEPAAKESDPYDQILALVGKCHLPVNWRATLDETRFCPMHTLAPGLCPSGDQCALTHAHGGLAHKAWSTLIRIFPELLLVRTRQAIMQAAAGMAATGSHVPAPSAPASQPGSAPNRRGRGSKPAAKGPGGYGSQGGHAGGRTSTAQAAPSHQQ